MIGILTIFNIVHIKLQELGDKLNFDGYLNLLWIEYASQIGDANSEASKDAEQRRILSLIDRF